MSIKALIFDFDGTIVDTETPEFESWRLEYAVFGVEMPMDLWVQLIGGNTPGLFDPYSWLEGKIGKGLDREALRTRRRAAMMDLIAAEQPRPGVEDWLNGGRARGLGLAIASTSRRPWVEQHLTTLVSSTDSTISPLAIRSNARNPLPTSISWPRRNSASNRERSSPSRIRATASPLPKPPACSPSPCPIQ